MPSRDPHTNTLAKLKTGERVITNDTFLDWLLDYDKRTLSDWSCKVRSIPNPNRVGILDQYEAWIGLPGPVDPDSQTDDEILIALAVAKRVHGRMWRGAVRQAWFDGNYGCLDRVSSTLQWLRNSEHPFRHLKMTDARLPNVSLYS